MAEARSLSTISLLVGEISFTRLKFWQCVVCTSAHDSSTGIPRLNVISFR
jgi:hypothetical protein